MNTMKGFYASISAPARLHGSYLEALSEITRIQLGQVKTLRSDLGWQEWSERAQNTAARNA
ncbi:MAG TPA: hypothetical protein VK249_12895 [Anaerolineales bacterium]|nr:hypothetical protein [Anaerolineales bacterium]